MIALFLKKAWQWLRGNQWFLIFLVMAMMQWNIYSSQKRVADANHELGLIEADITKAEFFEAAAIQDVNQLRQALDEANARSEMLQAALLDLQLKHQTQTKQFDEVIHDESHQTWRNQPVPSDIIRVLQ